MSLFVSNRCELASKYVLLFSTKSSFFSVIDVSKIILRAKVLYGILLKSRIFFLYKYYYKLLGFNSDGFKYFLVKIKDKFN